jgi:hypothetical protein
MDSADAHFEVVNGPGFREGALTGVYGERHESARSLTDKNKKHEESTITCERIEYAVL